MKKALIFLALAAILSVFSSASSINTIITRTSGKIKCTVYLNDVDNGSIIVVSAFKDGRLFNNQFVTVTKKTEEIFVDSDTNEIRVFVFEGIDTLKPVTAEEKVEIKLDSVTDPDWSDWV